MRSVVQRSLSAIALISAVATPAAADLDTSYVEVVAGLAFPLADLNEDDNILDYDDAFEESFKLGLRAGSGTGPSAFELTADATFLDDGLDSPVADVSVRRYRILVGGRHRTAVGKGGGVILFGRGGLGLDLLDYSAGGSILGVEYEIGDTDPGLGFEVGGGFAVRVGERLYLGGQLALPFAFHFDDDDPDDADDADLEFGSLDLDLLFTLGTNM